MGFLRWGFQAGAGLGCDCFLLQGCVDFSVLWGSWFKIGFAHIQSYHRRPRFQTLYSQIGIRDAVFEISLYMLWVDVGIVTR